MALREDIPTQHAHEETANVLHRKLEQHKVIQQTVSLQVMGCPPCCCCGLGFPNDAVNINVFVWGSILQDVLKNLELHRQPFQQIHKDRSVNGVPVPPEQLQDMAERSDVFQNVYSDVL